MIQNKKENKLRKKKKNKVMRNLKLTRLKSIIKKQRKRRKLK